MSELKIEYWPLERLRPYENNPRKNDHAVGRMTESLCEFGFRVPILARSSGLIIDGELRYKAALAAGELQIPVILADDMTDAQVRAFRIMINRSATWADWDEEKLLQELHFLQQDEIDLALTGFDQRELDEMLMALGDTDKDPDAVPPAPVTPIVRDGEVWVLGRHRLMCGDSCSMEDVRRMLNGAQLDMIWTDPPYNVDYQGKAGKIQNDKMSDVNFEDFLLSAHRNMYEALRPGSAIYVAHSEAGDGMVFRRVFAAAGFKLSACLIWRKQAAVLGRSDYHFQHEPILYGWKRGAAHRWYGNRKQRSLFESELPGLHPMGDGSWQFMLNDRLYQLSGDINVEELTVSIICEPKPRCSDLHPTTKPVALIERMIANSCPQKGTVGDFFGGSGSTLMACDRLGRSAYLMELDPRFAEVIIRRWQDYCEGLAVRENDGATLDDLSIMGRGRDM